MQILTVIIFIAFFGKSYQIFGIGNYGVTALDIFTLIFFIVTAKKVIWDGVSLEIPKNHFAFFFLCFIIAVLLSGITPLFWTGEGYIVQYLKSAAHLYFLCLFTFICLSYPLKPEVWRNVIRTWIILSIAINLFAIYQIIARALDWPLAWLNYSNISLLGRGELSNTEDVVQLSLKYSNFYRATSFFTEPSTLAIYNLYIITFLLIPFLQKERPFLKSKPFNIFCFVLSIGTLFLTFSISGFIGISLIAGSVLLFEKRKNIGTILIAAASSVILILVFDGFVNYYAGISVVGLFEKRISGIISITGKKKFVEGESFSGRIKNANESIAVWEEYPVFGKGLGLTYKSKKSEISYSDFTVLAVLAELGVVGLAAFVALFVSLLIIASNFIRFPMLIRGDDPEKQRLLGLVYYILVIQIVINFLVGNQLISEGLWYPLGMAFSIVAMYFKKNGDGFFVIKLRPVPLKAAFTRRAANYLKAENQK